MALNICCLCLFALGSSLNLVKSCLADELINSTLCLDRLKLSRMVVGEGHGALVAHLELGIDDGVHRLAYLGLVAVRLELRALQAK